MKKHTVPRPSTPLVELKKPSGIVTLLLALTLIAAFFAALWRLDWESMGIIFATLLVMLVPRMVERFASIELPGLLKIYAVFFVYASLFLGTLYRYYDQFWWWDKVLHASSAAFFGVIGFIILFWLYRGQKIKASPKTIAMFSFAFALAIGGLWEIVEFILDRIGGGNYWQPDLADTMWDLIVDAVGALIASVIGYFYLRRKKR